MKLDLHGRTALVSGSTAGIGFGIARGLAAQGALVWVNGRTEQRVEQAIAAIYKEYPDARLKGVAADVTTAAGAGQVLAKVDALDILVNNVGGPTAFKTFVDLTDEDWRRVFDVNVLSGVRLTRHYLPGMRTSNWGRVVFIASESGVQMPPEFMHYGAAKAAVIALARGVAETLVGTGVTVNSVLPGPTLSEVLAKAIAASGKSTADFEKELIEKRRSTSLIHRFTSIDEVANMVVYLCSEASSGTHGAALRVEGGIIKSAF